MSVFNAVLQGFVGRGNVDFKFATITLRGSWTPDKCLNLLLEISGKKQIESKTSPLDLDDLRSRFHALVQRVELLFTNYLPSEMREISMDSVELTNQVLPLDVRSFLVDNRQTYKYIVVDSSLSFLEFPFGLLFFPDRTGGGILQHGFFLSEKFTVVRPEKAESIDVGLRGLVTISSEDLAGSVREEEAIRQTLLAQGFGGHSAVKSDGELRVRINEAHFGGLHLCCHSNGNSELQFDKNGATHLIPLRFFNEFRFPHNSFVFVNICSSNKTSHDHGRFTSIAEKFLAQNATTVVSTEWPIDDDQAMVVGSAFYSSLDGRRTVVDLIHEAKGQANSHRARLTSMTYVLRGNPLAKLRLE